MTRLQNNSWIHRAYDMGLTNSNIFILISMSSIATITEVFGIGVFLPIFQFIRFEGDINALVTNSVLWEYILIVFNFFNIKPSLTILLILSFGFFLSRQAITYARLVYEHAVRYRISQKQQNRIFNMYIKADSSYHDKTPVGDLVNVITTEVNGAVVGVIAPIGLVVYSIMLLGYLIMLSILSWEMTLLSAITLLFSSRIPNIWIKKSAINSRKIVNSNKLISEFLVGRLRSPRLVRLAGNEDLEKNEFKNLTQTQRKFLLYAAILKAKSDVVMEPIVIGLSLIFLYFSYTFLHLQIEIIGLYLVIALRLLPIVKGIISEWHVVQRSRGSIEVLDNRLKAMQNSIEKDFGEKSFGKFKQSIVFNNVSYSYSSNKDTVLKNIKVEFEANKMSAIVGPSGSGKSTLIDLLPRLRTPVEGLIQIDDVDIKEYSLKSLRDAISYVPQFPQIFNGTVRNHILYGKMNATNEEVQKAACLAGAEDFINKLPQGFDTVLSDDAINISGGQRQRLDLARALLKGAPILILDEPTSNLDAESESVFKKTLAKIQKDTNTTIIIIVHKLSSIVDADKIIVLNQGAIDSIGAHSELLYHDGWYKKAWKMQELLE